MKCYYLSRFTVPLKLARTFKSGDTDKTMQKNPRRKSQLRSAVIVAVLFALGVTLEVGSSNVAAHDDAEAEVRKALLASATSFEKNDLLAASKAWVNDESLTVFESGHPNYGWADYRDNHLVPEMGEMKNTKYAFSDIKIHLAGKTAWATFKYTIAADVMDNGKQRHVDGSGLGTAILERRADGWRIVHWHSSAPRRAPNPAPQ
jgi:ketosteroid isomerase-like protein